MRRQVYTDKQEYDEMDDRDGNQRRSLPEFLYDGFFRKYEPCCRACNADSSAGYVC